MISSDHKSGLNRFLTAPNADQSSPTPRDTALRISDLVDTYSRKVNAYKSNGLVLAPFLVCTVVVLTMVSSSCV